uniref:Uncharacterized protein n=1 Tax=Felis catus TaxID=9685 RepID=A0ABI7ZDQ9_FELCA
LEDLVATRDSDPRPARKASRTTATHTCQRPEAVSAVPTAQAGSRHQQCRRNKHISDVREVLLSLNPPPFQSRPGAGGGGGGGTWVLLDGVQGTWRRARTGCFPFLGERCGGFAALIAGDWEPWLPLGRCQGQQGCRQVSHGEAELSYQSRGNLRGKVWGSAETARSDCEGLCWNLAARRLGEQPHAGSHSAGQFSSSFGSFAQPCTQWLHKADYKLQRIPEGAKSDAGANEPREPLIPVTEWDKLGKAWTTQIQAHQAAESLPWEPGVIIRPIQRGPGTLGARRPVRAGAPVRLGAVGTPPGPGAGPGRGVEGCACAPAASVKSVL